MGGRCQYDAQKIEETDLGTETLKTTWSSEESSSVSDTSEGSRCLRFQRGREYDFVTRRGSLEAGRGSGMSTQSWSKRTLGERGGSSGGRLVGGVWGGDEGLEGGREGDGLGHGGDEESRELHRTSPSLSLF